MSIFKEGNQDALYDFYYKRNRIQQIRGFITVVQNKTFAKASEVLRVSQSSVFSQVKSLENKLGIRLFKKQGRNIVLTDEGKGFYEKSLPILNSIDNLYEDFIDNEINGYTKVLKIAGHYIFLTKIFPKPLFNTITNTSLRFEVDSAHKYEALQKLEEGQLDITFFPCDKRDIGEYSNLEFTKLTEYRMCVYFGNNTPVTQDIVDNLYDNLYRFNLLLPQRQPFATKGTGFYTVSKRATENLQSIKKNIIYVEGFSMAKELAKQNLGICVFDDRLFSDEDKKDLSILYLPRDETFDLHYCAITKKGVQMKEGVKSLLKNVENHCKPSTL